MAANKVLLSPGFNLANGTFDPERHASGRVFYVEGTGFGITESVPAVPEEDSTITRFYDEKKGDWDFISFPHIHYGEKVTDGLMDDERAQKIVDAAVERALRTMGSYS